jgi:hypothetical protein
MIRGIGEKTLKRFLLTSRKVINQEIKWEVMS